MDILTTYIKRMHYNSEIYQKELRMLMDHNNTLTRELHHMLQRVVTAEQQLGKEQITLDKLGLAKQISQSVSQHITSHWENAVKNLKGNNTCTFMHFMLVFIFGAILYIVLMLWPEPKIQPMRAVER